VWLAGNSLQICKNSLFSGKFATATACQAYWGYPDWVVRGLTKMPDGPRYEDDFYAWTQYQAQVLRSLRTHDNRFDREHLAEEIEDLGKSERDAVRSQVRRILLHALKLAHSPARDPRSDWMDSIDEARAEIEDKLTPTLRRDIEEAMPRLYANVRRRAVRDLEKYGERPAAQSLPAECPYTIDQILAEDWYPEPADAGKGAT
jgi:hypothetical protein